MPFPPFCFHVARMNQRYNEAGDQIMRHINHTSPKRSNSGFSLIELLIVVAVILVIAAIAIPNFIQSRMRANESSAVQSLRNISTAQVVYSTTYGIGYSVSLAHLSGDGITVDQTQAGLIDEVAGRSGLKSGYVITYTPLTYGSTRRGTLHIFV